MKKLLPKRKPERKPSEEDFTVRKSKYATQGLYPSNGEGYNLPFKQLKKLLVTLIV